MDEPGPQTLPNVVALHDRRGHCRDQSGVEGIAYFAARTVTAGESLYVCLGAEEAPPPSTRHSKATSCSDRVLLDRWTRLQRTMLAPYLRVW